MIIIDSKISKDELREMQAHFFGDMVKAVVDLKRGLIALDSELHADLESLLLEDGSATGHSCRNTSMRSRIAARGEAG